MKGNLVFNHLDLAYKIMVALVHRDSYFQKYIPDTPPANPRIFMDVITDLLGDIRTTEFKIVGIDHVRREADEPSTDLCCCIAEISGHRVIADHQCVHREVHAEWLISRALYFSHEQIKACVCANMAAILAANANYFNYCPGLTHVINHLRDMEIDTFVQADYANLITSIVLVSIDIQLRNGGIGKAVLVDNNTNISWVSLDDPRPPTFMITEKDKEHDKG